MPVLVQQLARRLAVGHHHAVTAGALPTGIALSSATGALTGANVASVVVSAISVDAELPEGSFQISVELDGERTYSPAISYSADPAQLHANLQAGMDTLFGAGQVTVATQTGASAREAGFTLTFGGTLAFTDVANIRSHFGSASDAARNPSILPP